MSDMNPLQSDVASALVRKGVSVLRAETPEGALSLLGGASAHLVEIPFRLPDDAAVMASIVGHDGVTVAALEPTAEGCVIVALAGDRRQLASDLASRLETMLAGAVVGRTTRLSSIDGRLSTDPLRQAVVKDGAIIPLSSVEWEILCCLAEPPFRIWSREELIEATPRVPGGSLPDRRTIDAHVKNLRRKIEDTPHRPSYLMTARSRGYFLSGIRVRRAQ